MMLTFELHYERNGFTLDAQAELEPRVVGVFGRSGSGKTTLLHLLAGLLRPMGEDDLVCLDDVCLVDHKQAGPIPTETWRPPHRRRVGLVFQEDRLFPHLNVAGNLRYGERFTPKAERRVDFRHIVELLELGELLTRRPADLSGGQRRRVAIGRALLASPRLLLLDEPLTGLDAALRRQVLPFLRRVCDEAFPGGGTPILYVTHDLREVLSMTDHLLVLDAGRIVGCGPYLDLWQQHEVLDCVLPTGLLTTIAMRVGAHDTASGTTTLLAGNPPRLTLQGPLLDTAEGDAATIAIRPEDVAIATGPVNDISIVNQLPGVVTRLTDHAGRALVEVDIGAPLLVEISVGSSRRLRLEVGSRVWCLLKANAVQLV